MKKSKNPTGSHEQSKNSDTVPAELESDFLDFKSGIPFEYEGIISGYGKLPSTQNKGENFYFLIFQDGTKCAMSTMLSQILTMASTDGIDVVAGTKLKLVFKGKKKTKNGNTLNIIDVYIDTKKIEPQRVELDEFLSGIRKDLPF